MGESEGASTNFTAYINPYTVINNGNQMSKHIYVGTQRIMSKLCDAGAMADPTTATKATYTGSTLKYADKFKALTATVKARYDSLGVAYNGVDNKGVGFYKASSSTPSGAGGSYYYHSDHLGSANYITDETGSVSQHLEYIPYGETFVDERYSTWHSPYKFNGKERDEETGLTYYSQRYFDGNVWYTVDPLAHKYPNVSSYVYCMGNPVKYVDPDGRQFITPLLGLTDVLMSNKPVVTETMVRVGRATTETSSTGGKGINVERINAGRQAETEQLQKLGLEKNTESFTRVDPKTGKDVTTVPDGFKGGQTTEIKNLGQGQKQSLTEQLRAQKELSNENGTKPRLHINKEAGLTKPLQNAGFDITKYSIVPPAPSNKTQTQTNKPVWILFDKKH
jgi:RHS repeat-associated protein